MGRITVKKVGLWYIAFSPCRTISALNINRKEALEDLRFMMKCNANIKRRRECHR